MRTTETALPSQAGSAAEGCSNTDMPPIKNLEHISMFNLHVCRGKQCSCFLRRMRTVWNQLFLGAQRKCKHQQSTAVFADCTLAALHWALPTCGTDRSCSTCHGQLRSIFPEMSCIFAVSPLFPIPSASDTSAFLRIRPASYQYCTKVHGSICWIRTESPTKQFRRR